MLYANNGDHLEVECTLIVKTVLRYMVFYILYFTMAVTTIPSYYTISLDGLNLLDHDISEAFA